MPRRRAAIAPILALLVAGSLLVAACGGDDDASSKKTTTTEKSGKTTTTADKAGSNDSTPSSTVDDADFEATIDKAKSQLDAAGDDPCKVFEAFSSVSDQMSNAQPSNTAQRKAATGLILAFYRALADATPDNLSAQADTLRKAVDKIEKEGEDSNYSKEFLEQPKSIENDKDFEDATTKIMQAITTQCGGSTTTAAP